jgi:hypothetical protein
MPLVSEGLIQKAYGPLDLSGFYNSIDLYAKQAAAEAKAQKQALQKEYYTNEALFNKKTDKIREADGEEIMGLHNKFKVASQKLMAEPRMINNNPKEYYRLKEEADSSIEEAKSLARESRAQQEEFNKIGNAYVSNQNKFEDETLGTIKSLDKVPTRKIKKDNLWDVDKLLYKGVDISKVNSGLESSLSKDSIKKVNANQRAGKLGTFVVDQYEVPDAQILLQDVNSYVDGLPKKEKVASQIMENAISSGAVDMAWDSYNKLSEEDFSKFKNAEGKDIFPLHDAPDGTQTRRPIVPKPTGTTTADLKNLFFVQKFLKKFPKNATASNVEIVPEGKTALGLKKAEVSREASLNKRKEYADWHQKNHPNDTGELTDISSGIFGLVATGKAKLAVKVLQKIPNGFTNSVYKFGSKDSDFAKGNEAMAKKLGVKPEALMKMSVDDIAKKSGIPKEELQRGIITAMSSAGDVRLYDMNANNGYNLWNTDNKATFGPKAAKGFLANTSQEINSILRDGDSAPTPPTTKGLTPIKKMK